jgi:divalent metal cation (Fe/Co/Zn/Cd) transporter
VVIVGLIAVKLADVFVGLPVLAQADAIAALGVALIVIYVSVELGMRTIHGLLDQAPKGLAEQIEKAAEAIPGIVDAHQIRIRPSGPGLFIDAHIIAAPQISLQEAHDLTEQVEKLIASVAPRADVTSHVEPALEAETPAR